MLVKTIILKKEKKMNLSGTCPICDALVIPEEEVEESEILSCPDCHSLLVVDLIKTNTFHLIQAPQIEEDWGE